MYRLLVFAQCLLAISCIVTLSYSPTTLRRNSVITAGNNTVSSLGLSQLNLPFTFERNLGQMDAEVQYLARGPGYTLLLTSSEAVLALQPSDAPAPDLARPFTAASWTLDRRSLSGTTEVPAVLRISLVGANPQAKLSGEDELRGRSNYYLGDDPARWLNNVPNFAKVRHENVYPGTDLVYYGAGQQLEYDFIVTPGADPSAIRMTLSGADRMELDGNGDLLIHLGGETLRQRKPVIYQVVSSTRREIAGGYRLLNTTDVGFQISSYDATQPLIIDPILQFAAIIAGVLPHAMIIDSAANAFFVGEHYRIVGGGCRACPFFTTGPDAVVMKVDSSKPELLYTAVFSAGSSGASAALDLAIDGEGNAFVTGVAKAGFPTTSGAFQTSVPAGRDSAFALKLDPSGSTLRYSTFIGSNGSGRGIALDSAGNAYVAGWMDTGSMPPATTRLAQNLGTCSEETCNDAFVAKIDPTGSRLVYSTSLGGPGHDAAYAIAVDSLGQAHITGTAAPGFLTTANALQWGLPFGGAFVAKFSASGSALIYSTYLGGSSAPGTFGTDIALDPSGNSYITGTTRTEDFPLLNSLHPFRGEYDGFVTRLSPTGSLLFSTYLGGSWWDFPWSLTVDRSGTILITGNTSSCDFPMKDPLYKEPLIDYHTVLDEPIGDTAFQRQYATFPCATVSGSDSGPAAPFVTRLTPTGGLLFSSFLPGNRFSEFSTTASTVSSGDIVVATGVAASQYPFTSYFRPTSNSGSTTGALTMFARINLDTNPLPAITAVEAARVRGSSTEFHLLISGSGFNANSVVMWGGVPRPTRFATYRSLVATLSSQEVAVSGPIPVSVFNPPPGGGNSNPLLYHVNPLPVIESLSPPKTIFTEGRFTLFVMGRAFAKGVTIRMDGAEGPGLRPGDPPVLSLDFQPGTLPPPGIKTITVFNPPPGGGVSNAMTFTIAPPPQFSVASLVNAATNRPGPVTPGTLVSLFGAGLAFTTATASRVPLPIEMGGVEVRVGSSVAPLFHVSPSQINFAVPFQSQDVRATDLRLVINRVPAPPVSISLARFSPGIFTLNQQGTGQGAILIANTAAHAAPADSVPGARPARRGEVVSIYCTGLGTVSTSPSAGSPPVGTTLTAPSVTIGSEPATVTFSGLAPGFVGLYQVNVEVPAAAPEGSAVPVRLSIGGVESDTVTMAIE